MYDRQGSRRILGRESPSVLEREETVLTGFPPPEKRPSGNCSPRFSISSGQQYGKEDTSRRTEIHPFCRGFIIRPTKRMLPVFTSRIRNTNGRSALNIGVNGTDCGTAAVGLAMMT